MSCDQKAHLNVNLVYMKAIWNVRQTYHIWISDITYYIWRHIEMREITSIYATLKCETQTSNRMSSEIEWLSLSLSLCVCMFVCVWVCGMIYFYISLSCWIHGSFEYVLIAYTALLNSYCSRILQLWIEYMHLLMTYTDLLIKYMARLMTYMALLTGRRALLNQNRSVFIKYGSFFKTRLFWNSIGLFRLKIVHSWPRIGLSLDCG